MGYGQLHRAGFAGGKIYSCGTGRLGLPHLVCAFYVDAYGVVFSLAWGIAPGPSSPRCISLNFLTTVPL